MGITLEELAALASGDADAATPVALDAQIEAPPTPTALANLAKLKRLGICTLDAVLSLVGQAPIDPINLMGTLLHTNPEGWAFSAIDFSMVRVLARTKNNTVSAALRVDLMSNALTALVLNQANQLTIYKTLEVEPRPGMLEQIQALCEEACSAARREERGR